MTRWWFVRHAPVPDPQSRITGQRDVACDTSDEDQFAALADLLPRNAVLVESGLLRCRQTIDALELSGLTLAPPQTEPELIEQDFGHWQGHSWGDLAAAKDPDLADFWARPAYARPPGGESFADQVDRVRKVMRRLNDAFPDRDIIAVTHAGTIRAALCIALEVAPEAALRFAVEPLSLTRIDAMTGGFAIGMVNRT